MTSARSKARGEKRLSLAGSQLSYVSSHSSNGSASIPPIESSVARLLSEKEAKIRDACKRRNIDDLRSLAISEGGFLSDSLRQLAWPILLGCSRDDDQDLPHDPDTDDPSSRFDTGSRSDKRHGIDLTAASWKELPRHADEEQVKLDVNRAFVYYPNPISDARLADETARLSDLITEVLRRHPYLSYFQGYHDICQVFLLTLPDSARYEAVSRLSVLRIRDFMLPTLSACITQLRLIPELLCVADPELSQHLGILPSSTLKAQNPLTFLAALAREKDDDRMDGSIHLAAMQGTLTMYAHDIESLSGISRLFDALLAQEPVFSLYLFAEMVLSRRGDLLDNESAADDPDVLLWTLQKLPQYHAVNLDKIVEQAAQLYERVPPEQLKGWKVISKFSVLKTGQLPLNRQSEAWGEHCFEAQVREMKEEERRKKILKALRRYKRPVSRAFGAAMLVGLVAILLKRDSGTIGWWMSLVGWR